MAEDEPKAGFSTPGETGLGHGAKAKLHSRQHCMSACPCARHDLLRARAGRRAAGRGAVPQVLPCCGAARAVMAARRVARAGVPPRGCRGTARGKVCRWRACGTARPRRTQNFVLQSGF